jgi:hypothetical protein
MSDNSFDVEAIFASVTAPKKEESNAAPKKKESNTAWIDGLNALAKSVAEEKPAEPVPTKLPPHALDKPEAVKPVAAKSEVKKPTLPKKSTITKKSKKKPTVELTTVHKMPRYVVDIAKEAFPEFTNQTDAVTAYILAKTPGALAQYPVSDDIYVAVDSYIKSDNSLDNMNLRIRDLDRKLNSAVKSDETIKYALAYLIADRLGFRDNTPMSPSGIDFREKSAHDIYNALETFMANLRNQKYK